NPPVDPRLTAGLRDVSGFLADAGFDHAVAGGFAVSLWGTPRATADIDIVVAVNEARAAELAVKTGAAPLFLTPPDPMNFPPPPSILRTMLAPQPGEIESEPFVLDLIVMPEDYTRDLLQRRFWLELEGRRVPFVGRDDLIVLKLVAARVRDLDDIRGVIAAA